MRELMPLVASLLIPPLVSWLKNRNWPDWAKVLLSLATSAVAATIIVVVEGSVNLRTVGISTSMIFSGATVFYKTWFQNSRLNQRLEHSYD